MKINYLTAEAASKNDFSAFLSIYATILLTYNGNKTAALKSDVVRWYADAKPFLDERPDIAKPFTACYNMQLLGKACKPEQIEHLTEALSDKKFKKWTESQNKVPLAQFDLMKLMTRHLVADTDEKIEKTMTKLRKDITVLARPSLNSWFHGDVDSKGNLKEPKDDVKPALIPKGLNAKASKLAALVKQVAGRSSCFLTRIEAQELRQNDPVLYEEYRKLNKEVKAVADEAVYKAILSSGKEHVPVSELIKKMQSLGIQNNLPVGFTGSYGIVARKIVAYTKEGLELDRVPVGPTMMNPKYDPRTNDTYVCHPIGDIGARASTTVFKKSNKDEKFSSVDAFQKNEQEFASRWRKDLLSYDPRSVGRPDKRTVMACIVELLYMTKHRIGGKGNATEGKSTFGITTLTVGHMTFHGDSVTLRYAGKKDSTQKAEVQLTGSPEAIKVGQILHALVGERKGKRGTLPEKSRKDLVFTYPTQGGKDKPVLAAAVNTYMGPAVKNGKETGGIGLPITAHGFRHAEATKMAREIFDSAKFKPGKATQKEVDAWVKKKLLAVAKRLAHTKEKDGTRMLDPMTSLKSYIDPEVTHEFYNRLLLRAPKVVPSPKSE